MKTATLAPNANMSEQQPKSLWNSAKELEFIRLWQEHPCLFSMTSSFYYDRKRKHAAWTEIAAQLGLPVEKVPTRASSMRTEYVRLIQIVSRKPSKRRFQSLTSRQKWHLKHLTFLKHHLKKKVSDPEFTAISAGEDTQSGIVASSSSASPVQEPPKSPISSFSPTHYQYTQLTEDVNGERMKTLKKKKTNKSDNDEDIFGKQVACEMRLIRDPINKLLARQAITKVLYDAQDRSMIQSVTISQSESQPISDFLPFKDDSEELKAEVND